MTITPIQNVAFDDAATFAMGEAFDQACKSLRNGSGSPSDCLTAALAFGRSNDKKCSHLAGAPEGF
jgi:hypothetical protein